MVKLKRGQEEMVGFALIVIIVAIVLIIFLGLSLNSKKSQITESYEADSFVQAMLQYSTSCEDNFGNVPVKDLIFDCVSNVKCIDGSDSCDVLNSTLTSMLQESWRAGPENAVKGYELNINSSSGSVVLIKAGNATRNSKGAYQTFSKSSNTVGIKFAVYN